MPPEYKLIQLKILNGQELSQDEKNDYNDATDEEACKLIREIKMEIKIVEEKLKTFHGRKITSEEMSEFTKLSKKWNILLFDKKEIVAETDRLLIL